MTVERRKKKEPKQKNGKKISVFDRLGNVVTSKYKIILLIWLFILGGAIYPMIRLQQVLSYNELEFLPDNLEYSEGYAIYNALFPSNATGTTIIVIQSNLSISSDENMNYIRELTSRIFQEHGDSIYDVQSALSVYEYYNNSYWEMVSTGRTILNETLLTEIIASHQVMYETKTEMESLWNQIANLYLSTWFNISRTYYYAVYNTSLFDTGPDTTVYQIIALETDFAPGMSINSTFIDIIYNLTNNYTVNPYLVNDQVMHSLTLNLTNSTLFQYLTTAEGMTKITYDRDVYPLLEIYHQNWSSTFYEEINSLGTTIINGTTFSANLYDNSTLFDAYLSQGVVLGQLQQINQTAYNSLDTRELIVNATVAKIDISKLIQDFATDLPVSPTTIENALEPLIQPFIEALYDLGDTPTENQIVILTNAFIEQILNAFMNIYPPPESINDVPSLISQWVLSSDGKTSLILVRYNKFNKTTDEIDAMVKTADLGIGELAHEIAEEMNLQNTKIYHTGEEFVTNIWVSQAGEDAKSIDIFTITFVVIILLVIFCSFIAPLIPLIAIGSSIIVSMAFLWFISFAMDIHFLATLFLTVTSLGAGVDYCIFIFSRYNEERKKGQDKKEALKIAVKFAGESVFHSGLTVLVGFGAMIIPNFPLLRILGIAMCIGIVMSMLSALFVVPSIIMFFGEIIWWPKVLQIIFRPQKWFQRKNTIEGNEVEIKEVPDGAPIYTTKKDENKSEKKKSVILRLSDFITKRGVTITILTFVIAAPFIYFTFTMDTSTDFMGMLPGDFEGTIGRNILSESMSAGDPTSINLLIYDLEESPLEYSYRLHTAILCDELLHRDHVSTIRTTIRPLGITMLDAYQGLFKDFSLAFVGADNRSLLIEIYMDVSPYHTETEKFVGTLPDTVEEIFEKRHLSSLSSGKVSVIGYARVLYEIKNVTDNSFPIVVPVVVIGVYLVLFYLFGSYFTPIRLIITIALSIAITLGLLQLVFSVGFNVPIFWLLPLMLFSILMGLGLDYDIFLVTRIKEYYDKGMSTKEAIAHALDHTASIISACGILMAAAYSTLMFSQLWHLRELGFAFAIAIILDATVIRLIVVPAMMVLMEKLNWLGPKWLMKRRHSTTTLAEFAVEKIEETTDKEK
ncbi:MAG: MMPL family transporter [Candidatus Heimdallarchaeota archaeon]|nr:MMPL family transporter [Candidatus Heimdallarchaeota archaeon]